MQVYYYDPEYGPRRLSVHTDVRETTYDHSLYSGDDKVNCGCAGTSREVSHFTGMRSFENNRALDTYYINDTRVSEADFVQAVNRFYEVSGSLHRIESMTQ